MSKRGLVYDMVQVSAAISGEALSAPAETRTALIVDDSRLQRRLLASLLRKWNIEVIEAENALVALEMCKSHAPDIVLSDWMMPGMNGPEFCRAFRALDRENYGYFILLTSKKDKLEVTQGLDAGADDYLTKPVDTDELRARIAAGERILEMERQLSEKNRLISETLDTLQTLYDRIDQDLMQARKIQKSLVPELDRTIGPARINLLLEPCGHIGGDFCGMFSAADHHVAFYNIDVSGHGITSALMTARLGSYLSARHLDQNLAVEPRFGKFHALKQPKEVAELLNARLLADSGVDQYFTMAYAIANLDTGAVRLTQAGHPHPILLRANGEIEQIGGGGLPIGLIEGARFDQVEFTMEPGDRVLLYSDGFTEAPVSSGGFLDDGGLIELSRSLGHIGDGRIFLDALFCGLRERMPAGDALADDVSATLFTFEGHANPASVATKLRSPELPKT